MDTFVAYIDFKTAFDSIDKTLLRSALLQKKIDRQMYKTIQTMYQNTLSCVRLYNTNNAKHLYSDWFETKIGVIQGDTSSPTMFCIYIDQLIELRDNSKLGIDIGNIVLTILVYADDLVLLEETEDKLQEVITMLSEWCMKN